MVCNKEEDPKSPFNGWLKTYQIAIDFREEILSAQGIKSTNQKIQVTGDRRDDTQQEAPSSVIGQPESRDLTSEIEVLEGVMPSEDTCVSCLISL